MEDSIADSVVLISEDGQRLSIDRKSALQLRTFKSLLETTSGDITTLPVPAVKSTILAKVIEFLQQHRDDPIRKEKDPVPSICRPKTSSSSESSSCDDSLNKRCSDNENSDPEPDHSWLKGKEDEISDSEDDEYIAEENLAVISPWDQKFLDSLDLPTTIELTKAANYLNVPLLLDLACRAIAKEMTGLTAKELRVKFGLPSDYTPEEEAKLACEMAWLDE